MFTLRRLFVPFYVVLVAGLAVTASGGPALSVQAQQPTADPISEIDTWLTEIADDDLFSGAVLIARGGEVLLSEGYGLANCEWDIPNTPTTKFRIGSITKQFTAAAILLLQERGSLSVQDSICDYLEDCPEHWQDITIHHLLTHTSGIPSFTDFPDYLRTVMTPSSPKRR